jgi:DNA-binding IclR family transcriptional regulator
MNRRQLDRVKQDALLILTALRKQPGSTLKELGMATGLPDSSLYRAMLALTRKKLVLRHGAGWASWRDV